MSASDQKAGHDPIAIVGMGCRFPGSPNVSAFWRTVRDSRVWSAPIPRSRWNHELFYSEKLGAREHNKTYVNRLCMVDDASQFAPDAFGISPRRARIMDPQQRLFLDVVRAALEDAGYARRPLQRDRVGTYVGATVSDFMDLVTVRMRATLLAGGEFGQGLAPVDAYKALTKDLVPLQAYTVVGSLLNMVSANVNQCFDFGGPAFTTDAACSSALVALHEAVLHLRHGICDTAIVGGVYMVLSPDNVLGFARIGAVSASNACRPFDQRADGFVVGEGVGAVVLKRLSEALASQDHIYAVIRGVGINNDGKGEGPMTPRKEGQMAVLDRAYTDAGVDPRTIDVLEAHGTATPVGDATEIAALSEYRGAGPDTGLCALTSVKANVGHSMSAAGIAGLIRATLAVDRREITPHAAYEVPRAELALSERGFVVPRAVRDWDAPMRHPRRAGVNSFGFGGTNVHVVLEEAPPPFATGRVSVVAPAMPVSIEPEPEALPQLFLLSAPNEQLLKKTAGELRQALLDSPNLLPRSIAYSLSLRQGAAVRAAFVARTRDEVLESLMAIQQGTADAVAKHPVYAGAANPGAAVALLFPGQGAQAPDLARDLYDRFAIFRRSVDSLTAGLSVAGRPLLSYLYPRNGARERAMTELTKTEVCQPIMAAVGLSVAALLRAVGVKPTAVAGHSLGEFAAAADAGLLAPADSVALVAARGQHIADLPLPDPGAMAAVAADRATTATVLGNLADVCIANVNHPRQTVVSGTQPAVQQALSLFEAKGIKTRRLNVSHAFHSPLMAGLRERFVPRLEALSLGTATTRLVSAVASEAYPEVHDQIRALWADHATLPVDFVSATAGLQQAGANLFVQVGGGTALANMARSSLAESAGCFTAAGEAPDEGQTFLVALAKLFAAGIDLQAEVLFEEREVCPVTLPPSMLETRHLWPVKKEGESERLMVGQTETAEPLAMSKAEPHQPRMSASAGGDQPGAAADLAALFRQQMAVLDSHVAIIRQQNELLLRSSGSDGGVASDALSNRHHLPAAMPAPQPEPAKAAPAAAPSAPPAPAAALPAQTRSAPEGVDVAQAEAAVIAAAARITASPAQSLKGQTRLGADLGFDSLMVVELISALADAFPGLELPRSAFAGDVTISDLARQVAQRLAGTTATGAAAPDAEMGRYAVTWQAAPLNGRLNGFDDAHVVVLHGPQTQDLANRVSQNLKAHARAVTLRQAVTSESCFQAAHILDLRALAPAAAPEDLAAPVLAAIQDAQQLAQVRPASWRFVHAGVATSGLSGFSKALNQEWENTTVASLACAAEVVDNKAGIGSLALVLAEEVLSAGAGAELRLAAQSGSLVRQTAQLSPSTRKLAQPRAGQVILISGGAVGLGAKLARTLVTETGAQVALLGRRPAHTTEVKRLLEELGALGGRAIYVACDVCDQAAVRTAVERVTQTLGPVEVVVHAAGVSADGSISEKSLADARRVLETKLSGARNLWRACEGQPVSAFLALGSLAGRFGNAHQTDYAAANGALPDLLASLQRNRPETRVSVLDLPPWEGGGLVDKLPDAARKALAARVRFVRDEEGLPILLDALSPNGPSGEFVVAATVADMSEGRAWVRSISVDEPAYLADHVIASRPVLPLAGAADWMLQAATALDAQTPLTLRDLTVVEGVVLEGASATLRLSWEPSQAGPARLALSRIDGRTRVGFRATYQTANTQVPALLAPLSSHQVPDLTVARFYSDNTFHGPGLRAIASVDGVSELGITGHLTALAVDGGSTLVASLDGVLQLFGFWSTQRFGRGGLPLGLAQLTLHRMPEASERLRVVAHAQATAQGRLTGDADVFDVQDRLVLQLRGFEAEPREHGQVAVEKRAASNGHKTVASNGNGSHNGHHKPLQANGHAPEPAPDVPTAHFRIDEFPEVKDLEQRMSMAKAMGIAIPYFRSHEGINAATATIDGQTLMNFSSYNYLGFSGHPEVTRAAKEALDQYGSSVSASRIASGERPLHTQLEQALSDVLGTEDSIVMVGGHATNVSVLGHMLGPEDLVVHDSLAHDSILGGARLSGARRRPFPHNDVEALERILRESRSGVRRVLIAVEGVYSMDGDIAPLDRIIELKRKYGALLLVDEAHSIGVLGAKGRGVGEHFNVNRADVDLWMGTLSKSLASCGGYIGGTRALIQYLRYTVPGFVYSVGISPANAAAALAAIQLMLEHPELPAGLREKSRLFLSLCQERGLNTGPSEGSAVIPCVVGNSYICLQLSQALLARGINVQPILYPAVEENQARLRFFISVTHTEEQLRTTADILAEELYRLMPAAVTKPDPLQEVAS